MEPMVYLKARTKEEDEDLLQTCIIDAENTILEYCGLDEVPDGLKGMLNELSLRAYNYLGVEGIGRYSEGEISLSTKDLSRSDKDRLNRYSFVGVGFVEPVDEDVEA